MTDRVPDIEITRILFEPLSGSVGVNYRIILHSPSVGTQVLGYNVVTLNAGNIADAGSSSPTPVEPMDQEVLSSAGGLSASIKTQIEAHYGLVPPPAPSPQSWGDEEDPL